MKKLLTLSLSVCLSFVTLTQYGHAEQAASNTIKPTPALMSRLASQSLLTDIVKLSQSKLVAVGDRGHILLSSDGSQWKQAQSPVNTLLTDVFFLDDKVGWAVGHDVSILKTNDGGENWQLQHYSPQTDKPLFGVYFKDAINGFAFGAYGLFLRTKDGGKTWAKEFHGEFLHPDDLDYIEDLRVNDPEGYADETESILPHFNRLLVMGNELYLAGEVGLLAKSSDFGVTWQKTEPFYNGSFFDVAQVNSQVFVSGLRGNVFRQVEGNWQRLEVPIKSSVNRILAQDNKLVLVGNSGLLLVSKDGGDSFIQKTQADGKAITAGVFLNNQLILTSQVGIKVIDGGQF
jgi:photosystem II stability/assembly factor-like uncharacterized protein